MTLLFKKFKPFLDFTYIWKFPDKLYIPPRPDITSIYLEEIDIRYKLTTKEIKKFTNTKILVNDEIKYANLAYLDAYKKAKKLHKILLHNQEHLIMSGMAETSTAHIRYIQISHANKRITNILKCHV